MASKDTTKEYGGGTDSADQQRFWTTQIAAAKKEIEPWQTRAQKVIDVYTDKRSRGQKNARRLNLFTTNTNNLISALFGRIPKPDVSRRFKDPNDHAGRVAANIISRALITELENDSYFTSVAKNAIKDRLIPGAGFVWVRYVADLAKSDEEPLQITDDVKAESAEQDNAPPEISGESTPVEHIHWKDVLWSPARTWSEVTWIARRAYLDKEEFKERFPKHKDIAESKDIEPQLSHNDEEVTRENEIEVWEIWDKNSKKVYFYTDNAPEILDDKEDPYGLPNFFPCPKPLLANTTTSNLIPVPDYTLAQDQYEELNELAARKADLIRACKVAGAYDSDQQVLKDILEGEENTLVPIENWASFVGEKGGMAGAIQWVPIGQFAAVISQLNAEMFAVKQQIEEITGISDIIRGATSPYETASAQGMKAQYASMRFSANQNDVAEFFSEMIAIKAFLMAKYYDESTLLRQAGMLPVEGVIPASPDTMYVPAAIKLLKDELLSHINIQISVDALVSGSDAAVVQQKTQVLSALGDFIAKALPVVQAAPTMKEMMLQMIKAQVAGMPGAKELEGVIDQELTKALGGPSPEQQAQQQAAQQQQAQAAQQAAQAQQQAQMQLEQAKLQQAVAIEQERGRVQLQLKQMDLEHDTLAGKAKLTVTSELDQAKLEVEKLKLQLEARKLRLEELKAGQDYAGLDTSELALPLGDGVATQREVMMQNFAGMVQELEQSQAILAQQQAQMVQTLNTLMTAPMPATEVNIQRDSSGKIVGATIQ